MTAAESERQVEAVRGGVYVAGRREHNARVRDQEGAVELGQLLDRLARVRVLYMLIRVGVAQQRVQDHGLRALYDSARVADDEERPDLAPLPSLARYLDRERDGLLEHLCVDLPLLAADLLEYLCLPHFDQPPLCLVSTGNLAVKCLSVDVEPAQGTRLRSTVSYVRCDIGSQRVRRPSDPRESSSGLPGSRWAC